MTEDLLVVHAPEGGVIDDGLGARGERRGPFQAAHRRGGFAAGLGHEVDIEDHPAPFVFGPAGDQHPFGAPGGLAGALEMQPTVGLEADRP